MDPLRLVLRVVVTYILLLFLVRLSGKKTLRHANAFDFTLVLIIGDMVDDAMLGAVAMGTFAVGAAVLVGIHAALNWITQTQSSKLKTQS